ncbi:DUF1127 domain-containing protein [Rhizobium sp. ZK1]|uniref:DUF1127 domain-containing protein n=1 Tax=Rhizobium sp. ZK1 TaxID=3389872 RepID=UPI0039F6EE1C
MGFNQTTIMAQLTRPIASLRRKRKIRRATIELGGLDDFMLRDIGILRSDIEWFVRIGRQNERPVDN